MSETKQFYELVHPGGPRGIVDFKPDMQEQDAEFQPAEFYAVVFFPKITGLGPATAQYPGTIGTLSQSPEAAKAKFMDGIARGETWENYHDAGHRVRKVRIVDLGDADA